MALSFLLANSFNPKWFLIISFVSFTFYIGESICDVHLASSPFYGTNPGK